ncbi:unnamed protein product [Phyllotreta striolata]|uniref:CUB domain-containing protein n=1 Tax=Phyllotreta striolata TaxID=444603 RepID=A0A9N9TFK5_PHYSR|nr:unnamed protein product [Phyllotreta striolata]
MGKARNLIVVLWWYLAGGTVICKDIWDVRNNIERLPRVLNFFPVPIPEECNANDGRRKGICMNTYECRMEGGKSYGFCAHGFGVCCVFTATCNDEISNNSTYFVNPDFPDLTSGMTFCSSTIRIADEDVVQLRFDFVHFNLGQPNRRTGVCEEDVFLVTRGDDVQKNLVLCGLNSGQHAYFDVGTADGTIKISMNMSRRAVTRLWEVRITQIPFSQRAPTGCLQYFEGTSGTIKTMNFAENGRHLANQDYNICVRQDEGACSIAYEPCHEDSFRIHPNRDGTTDEETGSGDGEPRQSDDCNDRITVPCDSEDLLLTDDELQEGILAHCETTHCGGSLCAGEEGPCRIESTVTPFVIGVHFGENVRDVSPEDNLGMCLNYEQLPCNV